MKRVVIGLVLVTALVGFFVWLRPSRIDDTATELYKSGDLSGTIALLAHSTEPSPKSILLVANCYRQLGMHREFSSWIDQARANKSAADEVELALALYKIHYGKADGSPQELITVLSSAGALPSDARSAVVLGTFANNKLSDAQSLLDDWLSQEPESAQLSYLSAVLLNINGQADAAEAKLISTAERFPKLELAWLALADFYTRPPNVRFQQAELVLQRMSTLFSQSLDARLRLMKIQRRLGRQSADSFAPASSEAELLEQAKTDFEEGDVARSVERLKSMGLSEPKNINKLTDMAFQLSLGGRGDQGAELTQKVSWIATALALNGRQPDSGIVFEVAADRVARLRRLQDVNNKQSLFPRHQSLIDEANAITSPAYTPDYPTLNELAQSGKSEPTADSPGVKLYTQRCATCHGMNGDGRGPAACNLNPAPRSFREEPIRLVSTVNRIPSDADLVRTIRFGEPGTSMPAFAELTDANIQSLLPVLREFIIDGLRERFKNESSDVIDLKEAPSAESETKWILERSQPGSQLIVPELSGDSNVERGRVLFQTVGCNNCHSIEPSLKPDGKRFFDSMGRPISAPNLSTDSFHSGGDAREIYLRIALGIPGTPHPALVETSAEDIGDLTAFVHSIRTSNPTPSTNYQRGIR